MLEIRWTSITDLAGKIVRKPKDRAHSRFRTQNLVRYFDPYAKLPASGLSNLVNLSEGGLQFSCRAKPKVGAKIQMVINLMERQHEIPVVGRIVWVKSVPGRGTAYRVGVRFEEIDSAHRHLLRSLVNEKKAA